MPVIKVWCLPKMSERRLNKLHKDIVAAVVSIKELGLIDQNDMTCLFPAGMMKKGPAIIIEVTGLFEKPKRTHTVQEQLAEALGIAVITMFPEAFVECFVYPFDPMREAFYAKWK